MRFVITLLAFATSALAYRVTEPSSVTNWTLTGPNVVAWETVNTDAQNFTIVLSNQNVSPPTLQVLAALVDGSLQNVTVNPPSGGWKTGTGYRVNLVQSVEREDTIYAQSDMFSIVPPVSNGSTTVVSSTTPSTVSQQSTTSNIAGTSTTESASPAPSADTPTSPNGASPRSVYGGLCAGIVLLGALLA